MKKIIISITAIVALIAMGACSSKSENVKLADQQDTLSWAMGMSLAKTAKQGIYDFNEKTVRKAFESTMKGDKQPLDEQAYEEAIQYITFMAQQQFIQQNQVAAQDADKKQDELFAKLAENSNIKKADEGYYYEVLNAGSGATAKVGQRVKFDFKGINMITGEVIEQTYGQREPIIHVLGRPMFQGILLGLQKMNAGSKYRFYFPYKLVTGANGIPEYTPVIYEVELHQIL